MSLYKFHAFNENSVSALEAYSAWFAKPVSFNDPFEGLYKEILSPLNNESMTEMALGISEKDPLFKYFLQPENINNGTMTGALTQVAQMTFRGQQDNFYKSGICCFISDGEVNPFEEPLMWGHYGDGLKGFMLQFDNVFDEIFESESLTAVPVTYENEPPIIHCLEFMKKHLKTGSAASDVIKIMTTKSKQWEYENEVRFISFKNGGQLFKFRKNAIKSITVGSKMPDWQKRKIKAIADKHQITDLKEAFTRDDSYKVCLRALSI